MNKIAIADFQIGGEDLVLLAGPCVIESAGHLLAVGGALREIAGRLNLPFVLKSSYDKANRTSAGGFRGLGVREGLAALKQARTQLGVPVITDVHSVEQVPAAAEVADILQIPAFLSRQTDLLAAAGRSGRAVNIKKGQFLAPWDMRKSLEKVTAVGNPRVMLTERGASFGYNNLVVDMRSLAIMRAFGWPVVFDATHSVQLPGGRGDSSGGQREFVAPLARAAAAVGIDALFIEVHDNPDSAPCDGPNMLPLDGLESFLRTVLAIDRLRRAADEEHRSC